jgi:hypothetical protein
MARLKVVRTDGSETIHVITPAIEVAFETYAKMGLHLAFQTLQRQTDVYWLAWECLRRSGETVKPFTSPDFLDSLVKVEVLDDDPLD